MAEIWKPLKIDDYKHWIEKIIEEAENDLTNWETSFIESLSDQLDNGRSLSERQAEILERIYTEKTS